MRRRSRLLALTAAGLAALVAGCGGSSDPAAPSGPPSAKVTGAFPADGIRFTPPTGWALAAGNGPLVATAQAGEATLAVWRYPRAETLPSSKSDLKAARDALVEAEAQRDTTFQVIKTAPTEIAGQPAVQIRARQTIAGQPRTVRSTHIYAEGAEIVIDAYADADSFRQIDATVFRPLLHSLQVSKPGGA
jgi:hypothetical protein